MKTSTKLCLVIMLAVLVILGLQATKAMNEMQPECYMSIGGVR